MSPMLKFSLSINYWALIAFVIFHSAYTLYKNKLYIYKVYTAQPYEAFILGDLSFSWQNEKYFFMYLYLT